MGQFTDKKPRDTAWALVLSTVRFLVLLQSDDHRLADVSVNSLLCELELSWAGKRIAENGARYSLEYANTSCRRRPRALPSSSAVWRERVICPST